LRSQDEEGGFVPTGQESALRWIALAVLLAGGFLPPLDFFIVNVALSSIHEADFTWLTNDERGDALSAPLRRYQT
jgi:hypothetical protein